MFKANIKSTSDNVCLNEENIQILRSQETS